MENMTSPTPVTPSSPAPENNPGVKSNVAAALAYLFSFVGGLIVYLVYKDKFARFHGLQSMLFSVFMYVVYYIIGILPGLYAIRGLVGLASLVVSILLIIKAYKGEMYKLPVLGDVAEKHS
jgi:uncharacterized membrane protein